MNYIELINEYISKSGLSLGAIVQEMEELGIKVDRSYLSKLKTSTKYPASEEVNRAIATVTGGDPDALIFAAFLDKAPEIVKEYFKKISDVNDYLEQFAEVSKDNNLKQLLEVISQDEKFELFKVIAEDALTQSKQVNDFLKPYKNTSSIDKEPLTEDLKSVVKIPILKQFISNQHINCIDNIEGYVTVEQSTLRGKKGFALNVKDENMIGHRINVGDTVVVMLQPDVSPLDIAAVQINEHEIKLSRVKLQNDYCMLTPSNPTIEPMLIPAKNVKILGKVIEVKFLLP